MEYGEYILEVFDHPLIPNIHTSFNAANVKISLSATFNISFLEECMVVLSIFVSFHDRNLCTMGLSHSINCIREICPFAPKLKRGNSSYGVKINFNRLVEGCVLNIWDELNVMWVCGTSE